MMDACIHVAVNACIYHLVKQDTAQNLGHKEKCSEKMGPSEVSSGNPGFVPFIITSFHSCFIKLSKEHYWNGL